MYSELNVKSWPRILTENQFEWQPPLTVHLPIQPVHSPDLIHVDCALNVARRRVLPGRAVGDPIAPGQEETLLVQFAFDDPPFVPDHRMTRLSLAEGRYPIAHAEYYVSGLDLFHQLDYVCCPLEGVRQSLLWIRCTATNEGETLRQCHVRAKVDFQRECDVFDYHYIPFSWDASRWLPCEKVSMEGDHVCYEGRPVGKVESGDFAFHWEDEVTFSPENYPYRRFWDHYYAAPSLRFTMVHNVLHFVAELPPGESKSFKLALLTKYEEITTADLEALAAADAQSGRNKALTHFKSQLPDKATVIVCPTGKWGEIFTALQLSTLQMLIRLPDDDCLMPSQGGTSERHYVWVGEATGMLLPLLPLGHSRPVKMAVDYVFRLQDGGCPPEGRFTTTEGAVGTTGPRWSNTTGTALAMAADYYAFSHDDGFLDEYLPKMLRAANWVVGEIRATRQLNLDGSRPLSYGLMPFACGTDGDFGYIVAYTDAYTFWGLEKTVRLLESVGHPQAAEFRNELEQYRTDLGVAVTGMTRSDGYIESKIETGESGEILWRKLDYVCGAFHLAYCGAMDIHTEAFTRYMGFFEKNATDGFFFGKMDRNIYYMGTAEMIWHDIYLRLGEWKRAFMAMQTFMKYGMTQDTYQVQERFSKGNPAFTPWQPNASGNGKILEMMVKSFYFEDSGVATLLGGIPFEWLRWNGTTSLTNLRTPRGMIGIAATMVDSRRCRVTLTAESGRVIPREIRLPEHFEVQHISGLQDSSTPGFHTVTGECATVEFHITDRDNA